MRVWVTRAQPGAAATARRLEGLGHDPLVWPLLEVRSLAPAIDLQGVAALAFTSTNGLAAYAARDAGRDLPVFAVGDATAAAARAAGFSEVASARGDVDDLAALIVAARSGPVLHPCALHPAGDLAGALARLGVEARSIAVYDTVPLEPPTAPGRLDAILVHSPRAAGLVAAFPPARPALVLCISPAAAAPLLAENFPRLATAAFPNEAALLKLLDDQTRRGP